MALFYYQALERNGRKTKGMIEADSARHARQLLRGKDLIPVHIEARMNASAGGLLQRRRHAHRRVAAGRSGAVHAPTGNAGAGSNAAGNLLTGGQ
ncbi:type II secretion system protein F [Escherichia coli]|uniref:Type II secretion system protein F n=1 Tax=Escherichia coli TaxID=562 RepID=A0A377K038_ECOLX|nr:type II secretion system protein F [Escherichia coli]